VSEIVWIASYPKSGNTWIRMFIANYLHARGEPVRLNQMTLTNTGDTIEESYRKLANQPQKNFKDLRDHLKYKPQLIRNLLEKSSEKYSFVKTHSSVAIYDHRETVPYIPPARAVYVVRNPLDVAVSFAHHLNVEIDRVVGIVCTNDYVLKGEEGGSQVDSFLGSWSQHVKSWATDRRMKICYLRYEDMVRSPAEEFSKIIAFLGLPLEERQMQKSLAFTSFRALKRQESQERFLEAPNRPGASFFREGSVGQWRERLTKQQIETIVDHHREAMSWAGYLKSNGQLSDA